jgi:hypothetical protein
MGLNYGHHSHGSFTHMLLERIARLCWRVRLYSRYRGRYHCRYLWVGGTWRVRGGRGRAESRHLRKRLPHGKIKGLPSPAGIVRFGRFSVEPGGPVLLVSWHLLASVSHCGLF